MDPIHRLDYRRRSPVSVRLGAVAAIAAFLAGALGQAAVSARARMWDAGLGETAESLAGDHGGLSGFYAPVRRKSSLTARQAGRRKVRNQIASASRARNRG